MQVGETWTLAAPSSPGGQAAAQNFDGSGAGFKGPHEGWIAGGADRQEGDRADAGEKAEEWRVAAAAVRPGASSQITPAARSVFRAAAG